PHHPSRVSAHNAHPSDKAGRRGLRVQHDVPALPEAGGRRGRAVTNHLSLAERVGPFRKVYRHARVDHQAGADITFYVVVVATRFNLNLITRGHAAPVAQGPAQHHDEVFSDDVVARIIPQPDGPYVGIVVLTGGDVALLQNDVTGMVDDNGVCAAVGCAVLD